MIARVALATAAALALAGCGSIEMHQVVLRPQPGPTPRAVDVITAGRAVTRPFYEVALLQVIGRGSDANPADVVRGMAARARALGCDAVEQVHVELGYGIAHGYGVCVKYMAEQGAPPTTAPPSTAPPVAPPSTAPPAPSAPAPAAPPPPAGPSDAERPL